MTATASAPTEYAMFVDGAWRPARSGETAASTSPATGETLGTVPQGDRGDARAAIDAAAGVLEAAR